MATGAQHPHPCEEWNNECLDDASSDEFYHCYSPYLRPPLGRRRGRPPPIRGTAPCSISSSNTTASWRSLTVTRKVRGRPWLNHHDDERSEEEVPLRELEPDSSRVPKILKHLGDLHLSSKNNLIFRAIALKIYTSKLTCTHKSSRSSLTLLKKQGTERTGRKVSLFNGD